MSIQYELYKRNCCPKIDQSDIFVKLIQLPNENSSDIWPGIETKLCDLQTANTETLA